MLEVMQYKCNCYNELSYISVHQLTIRSFVLERKKKDEKNDCCHSTNNQIKGPELFQQSFHQLQWQPRNKEDSSVLLIKKYRYRNDYKWPIYFSPVLLLLKLLEMHPASLQNYCLIRLFMWNSLSQILYYYMEKKALKSRLENKTFFSSS